MARTTSLTAEERIERIYLRHREWLNQHPGKSAEYQRKYRRRKKQLEALIHLNTNTQKGGSSQHD